MALRVNGESKSTAGHACQRAPLRGRDVGHSADLPVHGGRRLRPLPRRRGQTRRRQRQVAIFTLLKRFLIYGAAHTIYKNAQLRATSF